MTPEQLAALTIYLPVVLTALATTIAGILSQDKLPDVVNGLLATAFIILAAILDLFLAGKLSGNAGSLIAGISTTETVLLATCCKPLNKWIEILKSSFFVFDTTGFHLFKSAPHTTIIPVVATPLPTTNTALTPASQLSATPLTSRASLTSNTVAVPTWKPTVASTPPPLTVNGDPSENAVPNNPDGSKGI